MDEIMRLEQGIYWAD